MSDSTVKVAATWEIDGQFDAEVGVSIFAVAADGDFVETICELEPFDGDWSPAEISRAHQISATPDLFVSLGDCLSILEANYELLCAMDESGGAALNRIVAGGRAAIAKASKLTGVATEPAA